ncbi:Alpha/beta-hydrolase [Mycena venus]|uniref:Alpha/beta-hydrolase n=1 Tax=Mycena venus TaxID=2733690 RepID=A0A8H6YL23_9AGAR|nr:Alpha/beta-hydrolase [Mycena venus]
MTAVVGLEGQSVKDMFADGELDFFRVEAGYMVMDAARSAAVAFSDLSPEEGLALASKMPDHPAISFTQSLKCGAYKAVAVSYLFCEDDTLVTPEVQNKIIQALESEMSGPKVKRHPVRSDHAINASHPKTVVEVVRKVLEMQKNSEGV